MIVSSGLSGDSSSSRVPCEKGLCEIAIAVPILGSGGLKVMAAWQEGEEGTPPLGEQQTHLDRKIKKGVSEEGEAHVKVLYLVEGRDTTEPTFPRLMFIVSGHCKCGLLGPHNTVSCDLK